MYLKSGKFSGIFSKIDVTRLIKEGLFLVVDGLISIMVKTNHVYGMQIIQNGWNSIGNSTSLRLGDLLYAFANNSWTRWHGRKYCACLLWLLCLDHYIRKHKQLFFSWLQWVGMNNEVEASMNKDQIFCLVEVLGHSSWSELWLGIGPQQLIWTLKLLEHQQHQNSSWEVELFMKIPLIVVGDSRQITFF